MVLVRGRICVEDGNVRVAEGYGRFLNTPVRSPFVYDILDGKTANEEQNNGAEHEEHENLNGSMKKMNMTALEIEIPYREVVLGSGAPNTGSIGSTPSAGSCMILYSTLGARGIPCCTKTVPYSKLRVVREILKEVFFSLHEIARTFSLS
ncbi:hypothetical protein EVAR_73184_1 [Eumeta japonica]|uniref:Uncharacterized protein n=1 Tax=Eumeta variegata TaxID=151549 RepID=A0A4C1T1Y4_EUMVA|nr:hypothetical protein EVAR_73184_1 [Eumeta japonica]